MTQVGERGEETFVPSPHTAIPIPRVVRWSLDPEISPTTMVDSTCTVCLECQIRVHDGPSNGYGYCACGCKWSRGDMIEETAEVRRIRHSMEGTPADDDDCPTC